MNLKWPKLWAKLDKYQTQEEIYDHLDVMTCLNTHSKMDRPVAYSRWWAAMERMYKVNGDLEF